MLACARSPPGLLEFIARAKDDAYGLRAAIYELQWPAVLAAFKAVSHAGADGKIICHAKADETGEENEKQIDAAGIWSLCVPRRTQVDAQQVYRAQQGGKPVSVWTGSTNLSRNALHGQLNVGHVIHGRSVAEASSGTDRVAVGSDAQ
jgi:phosphatidylserine/phosphatidylglycerophosphate/cardiolipin synthase-like enzyme